MRALIPTLTASTLVAVYCLTTSAMADWPAGYREFSIDMPHHDAPVEGAIWYPAAPGGTPRLVGDNLVFYGTFAVEDAPVADDTFPVVVASHGLGGNFGALSWLTSGLASRGAVVISVNHPNSSTWSFDFHLAHNHWTRAWDMHRVLDFLLSDPMFDGHLDPDRVMATGFSYGGWTAMSLAGMTSELAPHVRHCDVEGAGTLYCNDVAAAGLDLASLDAEMWRASYRDPRISAVAAIEPAFHYGLTPAHVADLVDDVLLIGLGGGDDRMLVTNFGPDGSNFQALLPNAEIREYIPAVHFVGLGICTDAGPAFLESEGEPPVCTDPEGADRAAYHRQMVDAIATAWGL